MIELKHAGTYAQWVSACRESYERAQGKRTAAEVRRDARERRWVFGLGFVILVLLPVIVYLYVWLGLGL